MKVLLLTLAVFIFSIAPLLAAEFPPTQNIITGSVPYVVDGDTLDVGKTRIRLWGINTPERKEPGYQDAKDFLKKLTTNAELNCMAFYYDRWKRTVASCEIDGIDIAHTMVLSGMARDYPKYSKGFYLEEQKQAQAAQRGFWQNTK